VVPLYVVKTLRRLRSEGTTIRAIAAELKLSTATAQKLVNQKAA